MLSFNRVYKRFLGLKLAQTLLSTFKLGTYNLSGHLFARRINQVRVLPTQKTSAALYELNEKRSSALSSPIASF